MTVTATRLADRAEPAREVPASTAVITREEIEASGARTVQEILSRLAGANLFDQIGNGIEMTLDLRGFAGTGITVLLDGARVNDPRNSTVLLETILPDAIDRIEVTRGAAAATVGGGSAAGVVNIITRAGSGTAAVEVTGATGTFATRRYGIDLSGRLAVGAVASSSRTGRTPGEGFSSSFQSLGSFQSPGLHTSGIPSSGWANAATKPAFTPSGSESRLASPGTNASLDAGRSGTRPAATQDADPGDRGGERAGTSPDDRGIDWLLSAHRDRTDGFRENAGGTLDRIAAGLGYTFGGGSRLSLDVHSADDDLGAPGALTLREWKEDPSSAPFNRSDGSDVTYRQGTVNWRGPLAGPFSLAANASYLSRDSHALTTGRAAAAGFGGFLLDAKVRTAGGAVQSSVLFPTGTIEHALTFGGEGAGGTSGADGCGTRTSALTECDPSSFLNSSNRTRRRDLAFFAQDSLRLGSSVTVLAGGRWDRSRFDYRESQPDPANDRNRSFSETSWKGGIAWNPGAALGLYASYGESFQPPTVEDLFAFPGFGSNPDLDPLDAKNYEVGVRGLLAGPRAPSNLTGSAHGKARSGRELVVTDGAARGEHDSGRSADVATNAVSSGAGFEPRLAYSLSLFRTNLSNEIVFDPTPVTGSPFGRNVNAGRSLHEGLEVTGDWRVFRWLRWTFAYARTRATFENGPNEGNDVPLVPKNRYAETTEVLLPRGFNLRVDLLHVGKQVLSNDDANRQRRLDGYLVVDARASWRPLGRARGGASSVRGTAAVTRPSVERAAGRSASVPTRPSRIIKEIEVFLEGRNLFDRRYATRGIYALDFTTFENTVFVTPAPGRTLVCGASLTF